MAAPEIDGPKNLGIGLPERLDEALTNALGPAKRAYMLGRWSRFVRPGFVEIGATSRGFPLATAFKNVSTGNFATVVVNTSRNAVCNQSFAFSGFTSAAAITPCLTDATHNIAAEPAMSTGPRTRFTVSL